MHQESEIPKLPSSSIISLSCTTRQPLGVPAFLRNLSGFGRLDDGIFQNQANSIGAGDYLEKRWLREWK